MLRTIWADAAAIAVLAGLALTSLAIASQEPQQRHDDGIRISWTPTIPGTEPIATPAAKPKFRIDYYEWEQRWDGVNKRWYSVTRSASYDHSDDWAKLVRYGRGWVEGNPKNRWYYGPYRTSR